MNYSLITKANDLMALISKWEKENKNVVAMDFEEESNLHCYGVHICIIQLYDKENYFILDVLSLKETQEGLDALKCFLEGPIEKIMFDCKSDASFARKALGIQPNNIFDIRLIAISLGFTGNLNALIQRNLGYSCESQSLKKRHQTANWMRRPIPKSQIEYALGDVKYLFELKESLEAEMVEKLSKGQQKQLYYNMKRCALMVNPEKPGWEKICNYKNLSFKERILIKHFYLARDSIAQKANVPPSRILEKQLIVAMAKNGTWEGILKIDKMRYKEVFERARLEAIKEFAK